MFTEGTSGSMGCSGTPRPPRIFQNHAIFRQFEGKLRILSKFWAQNPLGSELSWGPLTKVLDPPMEGMSRIWVWGTLCMDPEITITTRGTVQHGGGTAALIIIHRHSCAP